MAGVDDMTPDRLFARLASPDITDDEAEDLMAALDGREVAALPWVFRELHDAREEAVLHAAVRLLARWADRPVAAALPPALRALLAEPDVGDINKLAAAGLLETFGQPVDEMALAGLVSDPGGAARASLRAALEASTRAPALVNVLDAVARMPVAHVLSVIDDLMRLADPRSAWILGPLAHHREPEVAVSAIAAVDVMALGAATPWVAVAAESHTDETVRAQATRTTARLAGAAGWPVHAETIAHGVYRSAGAAAATGGALVVLAQRERGGAPTDPVKLNVLTFYHHPVDGVHQYAAAELVTPAQLESLLDQLASEGAPLAVVSQAEVVPELEAAIGRTLAVGGAETLGYLAWPAFLGAIE